MNRIFRYTCLLFLSFLFLSCTSTKTTQQPLNITKTDWSGRELIFVEQRENKYSGISHSFQSERSRKQSKYNKLVKQKGTVLGVIKKGFFTYWIIQLNSGNKIYTSTFPLDSEYGFIRNTYFIDDLEEVKKSMVGKTIWLNEVSKQNPLDLTITYFVYLDLRIGYYDQDNTFKRFDKVEVINVIPFRINGSSEKPYYLKIKADGGENGYIQYTDDTNKYPRIPYFLTNPLPKEWGEEILTLVKYGEIKLGMTTDQVRVSWGNPIEKNITGNLNYGVIEQWVYLNHQYIYFKNGILSEFQSF